MIVSDSSKAIKNWKGRAKKGYVLKELLIAIAVIAIFLMGLYVDYKSITSGAKVNGYVDFITKVRALMIKGVSQCGLQTIQNATSISALNTALQQCNAIAPNSQIPTKYMDATVFINPANLSSGGTFMLTLSGLSYDQADQVAEEIDAKYGQQFTSANISNGVPCSANNGVVTCNLSS